MNKVLNTQEIGEFLGFGKTKMTKLYKLNVLPVVKVGNGYITTIELLEEWIKENQGKEIFF